MHAVNWEGVINCEYKTLQIHFLKKQFCRKTKKMTKCLANFPPKKTNKEEEK